MRLVDQFDVQSFKKGDEEAFERIYNAYKNIVFHECLLRLKCKEDAEDCFQEIFIKLIDKIKLYDSSKSSFDAWFTVVYKNHISNYYRSKCNAKKYNEIIDYEDVIKFEDKSHYYIDLMCEITNLIGKIDYEILIYRIRYGLTFRKIAKIMGSNKDSIRKRYLDAIEVLKNRFDK